MEKLKDGVHLSPGSREELEIRGCSIWAVEVRLWDISDHYGYSVYLIYRIAAIFCGSKFLYLNNRIIYKKVLQ